ncbi:hypothetical protein DPMN_173031 [Dreissena polymorpha]|uniref:Uncharacterized protein n=1 Tax=Dreissena polymorpha TaxID=45954 RepID=A0A9D4E2N4_DREPO|nr:hypothetical protein DPMN_173031 [Dreissena polymorpha]
MQLAPQFGRRTTTQHTSPMKNEAYSETLDVFAELLFPQIPNRSGSLQCREKAGQSNTITQQPKETQRNTQRNTQKPGRQELWASPGPMYKPPERRNATRPTQLG